jgi:hypothetical protein
MNTFEMIQHPLDWVSLTGSMAGLDEIGRDSADQLMTMIGDMQFCKGDIRGTCARYFFFIDTEWFCKLCRAANIDCRKLQNYLLTIEKEAASGLDDAFDDPQASFRFPRNEEQPKDGLYAGSGSQPEIRSEILSENNEASDNHHSVEGPTIQKPAPKSIRVWNKMERFGYR